MRAGLGYDDVVNYQSGAYAVGTAAGTAVGVATVLVNPCAVGGLAGNAVRGLNAVNGVASAFDAGEAFGQGDAIAGMMALAGARASFSSMLKACFAAGTPIRTPSGSKAIEALVAGDLVLSRDEFDLGAPVVARRVLQAFARVSPVLEVLVEGRTITTTGEHPFWVAGEGWTPAGELGAGDVLVSHDGQELPVTAVRDAGRVASVYNVEVEHDHTYFVGEVVWGFSVWAHNKCFELLNEGGKVILQIVNKFAVNSKESRQLQRFTKAWNGFIAKQPGQAATRRQLSQKEDTASNVWKAMMRRTQPGRFKGKVVGHVPDAAAGGQTVPVGNKAMALLASVNSYIGGIVPHIPVGTNYHGVRLIR